MVELAENVRTFLEDVHLGVIATITPDGAPHQTALWYVLRGDTLMMNTGVATKKVRNRSHRVGRERAGSPSPGVGRG